MAEEALKPRNAAKVEGSANAQGVEGCENSR